MLSKKSRNLFLFGWAAFIMGLYILLTVIKSDSGTTQQIDPVPQPVEPSNKTQSGSIIIEKDLSKLLITEQTPKIVKCNFTGTYQVTQDIVYPQNGAKCNDFKSRTLTYDNVISECSRYLDSNEELFLHCSNNENPVRECNGVVLINVGKAMACEYWVTIKRVD